MEFIKPQAEEVLGRIDEIRKYYDVWEAANGGTPLISKSMLAFSLGLSSTDEIDDLLEMLDRRGILGIQGDQIRLSPPPIDAAVTAVEKGNTADHHH